MMIFRFNRFSTLVALLLITGASPMYAGELIHSPRHIQPAKQVLQSPQQTINTGINQGAPTYYDPYVNHAPNASMVKHDQHNTDVEQRKPKRTGITFKQQGMSSRNIDYRHTARKHKHHMRGAHLVIQKIKQ